MTEDTEGKHGAHETEKKRKARTRRGGFNILFEHLGKSESRAVYDGDTRTISINLDHPYIHLEASRYGQESKEFLTVASDCAITEYAIALASELAEDDYHSEPIDYVIDIRETIDRITRLRVD